MRERNPIRVVHWGLDEAGLAMARLVLRRSGLETAGAIDSAPERAGRDLGELIGYGEQMGIPVGDDPTRVLTEARPDITLIAAAGSRLDEVGPKILQAMEAGSNVICLAEELAYPWAASPELAESIDELAHAHGVTVLGTGLNPGFIMDTMVLALTGCCLDVERIRVTRITDISPLGSDFARSQGVGLSPSHFAEQVERGRIVGHLGLEQSIHLIADALGWRLDRVEQERRPVVAEIRRESPHGRVEPGQAAGTATSAVGYVDGRPRIVLEVQHQVSPEMETIQTGDHIEIDGEPNLRVSLEPGIPGLKGTAAVAVNMIASVLQVGPGMKSMADLPVPRAVLGDLRDALVTVGPTIEEELSRGWHEQGLGGHEEYVPFRDVTG